METLHQTPTHCRAVLLHRVRRPHSLPPSRIRSFSLRHCGSGRNIAAWQGATARRLHTQVTAAASPATADAPPLEELKAQLLDSLFGIERGLNASSEIRAEINELISQLEAANPSPSPNKELELLNGTWKLVYTSNSELMALLGLSRLPFVTVGDIFQRIDSLTLTVKNQVQLTVPGSRTSFSATASFEISTDKRLQVRFERGRVATPELLQDIDFPTSISVLGQPVDLTSLKDALKPVNVRVKGAVSRLASLIEQQPDLQFPIPSDKAQSWLINTFLDSDLRISRGDGGSIFILEKDSSVASSPASVPLNATAI